MRTWSLPSKRGRNLHGVRFVLCDDDNLVRVHCPVDDLPPDLNPDEIPVIVSAFAQPLADLSDCPGVLVVLTRPGPSAIIDLDRHWFRKTHEICAGFGIRVLGVHLMTPHEHREVVLDAVVSA